MTCPCGAGDEPCPHPDTGRPLCTLDQDRTVGRPEYAGGPSPYPECERLAAIHVERRAIAEFVEWATSRGDLALTGASLDDLIMGFYGIDQDKIETERRQMLDRLRTEQEN